MSHVPNREDPRHARFQREGSACEGLRRTVPGGPQQALPHLNEPCSISRFFGSKPIGVGPDVDVNEQRGSGNRLIASSGSAGMTANLASLAAGRSTVPNRGSVVQTTSGVVYTSR